MGAVLVVGASGLVGTACIEEFAAAGWDVVALSRRRPELVGTARWQHVSVDLRDREATRLALAGVPEISHVVFAAVHELPGLIPGWSAPEQQETNAAMLRHVVEPLTARGGLEHVSLLQGTKAYGAHLHPMRIPGRERHPRDDHPNFYWLQEDFLRAQAESNGFSWTILRPQVIVGPNHGVVMNLVPVIGAFGALCAHLGRPFGFPGGASNVWEAADCRLVAGALRWAAQTPAAGGQHFNLSNGEVFGWEDIWPAFAEAIGLEAGPPEPVRLSEFLPAQASAWDEIVRQHGLRQIPMPELLGQSHHYADLCFAYGAAEPPPPCLVSTVKIRQAGFGDAYDTEHSFQHWLRVLGDRKVLPRLG